MHELKIPLETQKRLIDWLHQLGVWEVNHIIQDNGLNLDADEVEMELRLIRHHLHMSVDYNDGKMGYYRTSYKVKKAVEWLGHRTPDDLERELKLAWWIKHDVPTLTKDIQILYNELKKTLEV